MANSSLMHYLYFLILPRTCIMKFSNKFIYCNYITMNSLRIFFVNVAVKC